PGTYCFGRVPTHCRNSLHPRSDRQTDPREDRTRAIVELVGRREEMSVALLIRTTSETRRQLVPIAPQSILRGTWLPGAQELALEWVAMMETGFDVTSDNREAVVAELERLREW